MTKSPRRARKAAQQPSDSSNPFRLNLEQQRKRAKELHHEFMAGSHEAVLRFRTHHPKGQSVPEATISKTFDKLSDAQAVIARELGASSWPNLKAHITLLDKARRQIGPQVTALDRKVSTIHVRCGSDLKLPLREAGFSGDFLEYSNPLCQGPVIEGDNWLSARAAFIAATYRQDQPLADILAGLQAAEDALRSVSKHFDRVVLWFEHDSYDQLILARCLDVFHDHRPKSLEMVAAGHYPGSARFIGLGQLPPESLRLLWEKRKPVSEGQLSRGKAIWRALRNSNPTRLAEYARAGLSELPFMAAALKRHCQELPWTQGGLSLTERLILELLVEESRTASEVFFTLNKEREPLPWLGDLMLKTIIENMIAVDQAPFSIAGDTNGRAWWRAQLEITDVGRRVLAGEIDWLSLYPQPRWVGGVLIDTERPSWRWNAETSLSVLDSARSA